MKSVSYPENKVEMVSLIKSILDPRLKKLSDNKVNEWRRWFDTRLDDAIEAASTQQHPEIERKYLIVLIYRIIYISI